MTNKEINESVARNLGWFLPPDKDGPLDFSWCRRQNDRIIRAEILPNYCEDISLAFEVIEAMGPHFNGLLRDWDTGDFYVNLSDGALRVGISEWELYKNGDMDDPSPAKAICLAFLKLKTIQSDAEKPQK